MPKELVYSEALRKFDAAYVARLMRACEGRINHASRVSGISKVTLIKKIKKSGLNWRLYKMSCEMGKVRKKEMEEFYAKA